MTTGSLIPPHGGALVNRLASPNQAQALGAQVESLPCITLSTRQVCDLEMIATGAYSPLTGFVGEADFRSICAGLRLSNGTIWPIPITLAVDESVKAALRVGGRAALRHPDGTLLALIDITEIYPHEKMLEIRSVFGTEDAAHPGVKDVLNEGDWLVAGPVHAIRLAPLREPGEQFADHRLTPAQTRREFEERGWNTIVAFQTRNPIHRAHEYLTKCAQELCDGLLIHPLVGQTQPGDVPAHVRMKCYEILIEKYYVPERTMLGVMPAAMRYAGPREAILHALARRNYGCTHFIVGRDHAGVGDYYGSYDAQMIFDRFTDAELGITPLKFEHTAWCHACEAMTSPRTCPHGVEQKVALSGTKLREMLKAGQRPPIEFTRPEVADILIEWARGAEKTFTTEAQRTQR